MNQELLDLAKAIDDNDDAISDALEAEDLELAEKLSSEKVVLFRKLYELTRDLEDRTGVDEYLQSLYEVTAEQRDILVDEHEKVRRELSGLKKGSKGQQAYRQVRRY